MHFAVFLSAFFAAVSSASATLLARQNLPACALECLAGTSTGSCSLDNYACLCEDQSFINSMTTCIESSCSDDLQAAETAAELFCAAAGVILTPNSTTSTTAAAATSTTKQSNANGGPVNAISIFAGTVAAFAIAAIL